MGEEVSGDPRRPAQSEMPADLRVLARELAVRERSARVLAETGSTNDDARAWAAEGAPSGAVVVADTQTRGRGRHGRAWSSPSGASLALSVVLRPSLSPIELPKLALVAGLAVRRAVAAHLPRPSDARVKWPNDVVIGAARKKLAGVLVEGSIAGQRVDHVVVGVGINVARIDFPPELHATSLSLEGALLLDGGTERATLALALLDALDDELAEFLARPEGLAARLAPHDALLGCTVRAGETRGVADGIAPDGRLRIRAQDAVVLAHAGEVVIE